MSTTSNLYRLQDIIVETNGCDPSQVTPETKFRDLGCDSIEMVAIFNEVELEFGVTCENYEVADVKTVAQALELIENKLKC